MTDKPIVLVTGASGSIGRALVHSFSLSGYRVIATDLAGRPDGIKCWHYLTIDLQLLTTDQDYAQGILLELKKLISSDGLNTLVNNAAIQFLGGVDSLKTEDFNKTLNVNLIAPFVLTQALLPELEAVQGNVINISSVHARLTKPNFVAYATSKAALSGLTRAMAVDLGGRVRINAIEPAAIATEMLNSGFKDHPQMIGKLARCHPQGRIGTPEEIAALVLAVAGGEMKFVHGACIPIDGGISARLFDPC